MAWQKEMLKACHEHRLQVEASSGCRWLDVSGHWSVKLSQHTSAAAEKTAYFGLGVVAEKLLYIEGPLFPGLQILSAHDHSHPTSSLGRCRQVASSTGTHQPACLDKSLCNASSLAGSHPKSQERTVFQPQWHHFSLILVTHWLSTHELSITNQWLVWLGTGLYPWDWVSAKYVCIWCSIRCWRAFLVAQMVKNLPAVQETQVPSLGGEDPMEEGMATHSSILAWELPEEQKNLKGYSP